MQPKEAGGSRALTYTTLDGDVLDLSGLTGEQGEFLAQCLAAYRSGSLTWGQFTDLVSGPENPLLRPTRGWITRAVWETPLFRALRDLEHRVGLRTGELAADGEAAELLARDPVADEWIPAAQAAVRKGVSRPGLHQAIQRGDLIARPAKPGGSRLVVSANSLARWEPIAVRQAAGRARGHRAVRAATA